MHKITVWENGLKKILFAKEKELLSKALINGGINVEHPCGGKGICGKCRVLVEGKEELSCKYKVNGDILVKIPQNDRIETAFGGEETGRITKNVCLCLDAGTTTLALALVSCDEKKIIKQVTRNNPQRIFAADVMSRIDYVSKNGVAKLNEVIINELKSMIKELLESFNLEYVDNLFVAGNTTMLHILFGVDCSSMGYAPYTPVFLDEKCVKGNEVGLDCVGNVIAPPGISAFVGADIVAGLNFTQKAIGGKYNFLVDLGTNAEVVLYSENKLYCTAAAAGPCFEGVNISSGMSATEGAIYSIDEVCCRVIGEGKPRGICATGLIDSIALMLEWEIIDETGFMEEKCFEIADGVCLKREDVREFQLAKSAINSAMEALLKKAQIENGDVDKVFVSGGFSAKMNTGNAIRVGLLPAWARGRIECVNNSCLMGLVKYACEKNDLDLNLENAEYVDLAKDENFRELFIDNMMF